MARHCKPDPALVYRYYLQESWPASWERAATHEVPSAARTHDLVERLTRALKRDLDHLTAEPISRTLAQRVAHQRAHAR